MKERPILFSGPMVRAILEGRKTQTRRVVKFTLLNGLEQLWPSPPVVEEFMPGSWAIRHGDQWFEIKHPWSHGDRLWVRETFAFTTGIDDAPLQTPVYRADIPAEGWAEERRVRQAVSTANPWKPSIFMPRWVSRITLEVTGVRVERLQDITQTDVIAEGFPEEMVAGWHQPYAQYWDELHAKGDGVLWESNPWVWVIEFRNIGAAMNAAGSRPSPAADTNDA